MASCRRSLAHLRSEVMQTTRNLHHKIVQWGCGITAHLLHAMAPFAPSNAMFNPDAHPRKHCVLGFVCGCEGRTSELFLRLIWRTMLWFIALKAGSFHQATAWRQRRGFLVTEAFSVSTASLRAAQGAHESFLHSYDKVLFHCRRRRFFPL
jgi:hypothetical protein